MFLILLYNNTFLNSLIGKDSVEKNGENTKPLALTETVGTFTNEIASSEPVTTNIAAQIESSPKFGPVQTFMEESKENKIEMTLKWIVEPTEFADIISGKEQIRNITSLLDNMRFNGYLRLFEIDISMIRKKIDFSDCNRTYFDVDLGMVEKYFTPVSWTMLENFKANHKDDKWMCPQCRRHFGRADGKWKCERCLLWYHEKCSQPKQVKRSDAGVLFCFSCFFNL